MNFREGRCKQRTGAFTLIELLVVIVIIAVLASILLPIFGRTKLQADEVKTMSNMKQMGVAMILYANDNNQMLPNRVLDGANDPKWPAVLAQYATNVQVYASPVPDVSGQPTYKVTDPALLTSSQSNFTSYMYNGMNDLGGLTDPNVKVHLNAIALPAKTILLGIPYPQHGFYMDFNNGDNNNDLNKTAFPNGTVYMFCDGSSRMLVNNNDSVTYKTKEPPNSGTYTDWLWLFSKSDTDAIQ